MATLFKRLKHYCHCKHHELPSLDERQVIGKQILAHWFNQKEISKPLHYKPSTEPEETYKVLSYPNEFIPTIDSIIDKFFKEKSPPPKLKKQRQRIPMKAFKSNYLKPYK